MQILERLSGLECQTVTLLLKYTHAFAALDKAPDPRVPLNSDVNDAQDFGRNEPPKKS